MVMMVMTIIIIIVIVIYWLYCHPHPPASPKKDNEVIFARFSEGAGMYILGPGHYQVPRGCPGWLVDFTSGYDIQKAIAHGDL